MPNLSPSIARQVVPLEVDLLSLMALHGLVALALRHPSIGEGYIRKSGLLFCDQAIERLVEGGLLTPEEAAEVHRVEQEAP